MSPLATRRVGAAEYTIFITDDGEQYILDHASQRSVLTEEGTGMPPIDYVTERGPFQNGVSIKALFLQPRIIQMHIRQNFASRDKYWQGRAAILDMLRPNRTTVPEGTLRRILIDGTIRDIKCVIQQGPAFSARKLDAWDEWAFDEVIRFVCNDPTYYDPTAHTATWINQSCGNFPYTFPILLLCPLSFPITFPLLFLHFGADDATQVAYAGNWISYPSFAVTGPISTLRITNNTTVESLILNYAVDPGESVAINLSYGDKSITLTSTNPTRNGLNLIPYLTQDSDLATFHLEPGVNAVLVAGYGTGSLTQVVMTYYDRYIGI